MDDNREKMLREVMAADFTLVELNLYLNTHPCDAGALAIHNSMAHKSKMLRDAYERKYGPLTAYTTNMGNTWRWIESPWPWEGM